VDQDADERARIDQQVQEAVARAEAKRKAETDQEDADSLPSDEIPPEGRYGSNFSWSTASPEERTVGDTTPAGAQLKPSGDQLAGMESDKPKSPLDRLTAKSMEMVSDIRDSTGQFAETVQNFRQRGPSSPAHAGYTGHGPEYASQPTPGVPVSDIAGSVAVVLVGALAGAQHLAQRHHRKEHEL
jgi:hypothetical protein